MFGLRPMEILLIAAVLLLLFGATRLPQLGTSLGSAIRNFKKGFTGDEPPEEQAKDKKVATLSGTGAGDQAKDREKAGAGKS